MYIYINFACLYIQFIQIKISYISVCSKTFKNMHTSEHNQNAQNDGNRAQPLNKF